MDEQNTTEQQRRQRADLVDAFSRRAWQPTERSKVGPRILAGGAALIVVAGAALAVGAATSHRHDRPTDERARPAAMTGTALPTLVPTPTPATPSPKPKSPGMRHPSAHRPASDGKAGSRSAHGVRISGKRRLLIRNVMTGMCVDVPGYGDGQLNGKVEQHTCHGSSGDNQLWDLVVDKDSGPRGATLFTIRNSKDGLCLDLPGSGTVRQAGVTEYGCRPGAGDNQMWYLERKASGRYWIRSYDSVGHQCLDVSGLHGSGGQDANLTIYPCSLQDDHLWAFS